MVALVMTLMFVFLIKHLVVDFFLQGAYIYENKGKYGHPGGIFHAAAHGMSTFILLYLFREPTPLTVAFLAMKLGLLDTIVHYHIDWVKVNIDERYNWKCNTSEFYWWVLGVDQFLHMTTYIVIISMFLK